MVIQIYLQSVLVQIYAKDIEHPSVLDFLNPILGHGMDTFDFKGDNVHIKMDTEEMSRIAMELKDSCEFVDGAIKDIKHSSLNLLQRLKILISVLEKFLGIIASTILN